jgi:DNA ligase (NAD+)
VRANSIAAWRRQPENLEMVRKLLDRGVRPQRPRSAREGLPLSGQTFLITGRLEGFTRVEAENAIEELGGKVASSVNKNLHHLVVGEDPGSKLPKAQKLGIPIHDEAWLVETLRKAREQISG